MNAHHPIAHSMTNKAIAKPLTLYVEDVELNPDIMDVLQPAIRSIDIEMSREHVEKIIAGLRDYLDYVTVGSLRVRFTGRMTQ